MDRRGDGFIRLQVLCCFTQEESDVLKTVTCQGHPAAVLHKTSHSPPHTSENITEQGESQLAAAPLTPALRSRAKATASCGKKVETPLAAESWGHHRLSGHNEFCLSLPTCKNGFNNMSASVADFRGCSEG